MSAPPFRTQAAAYKYRSGSHPPVPHRPLGYTNALSVLRLHRPMDFPFRLSALVLTVRGVFCFASVCREGRWLSDFWRQPPDERTDGKHRERRIQRMTNLGTSFRLLLNSLAELRAQFRIHSHNYATQRSIGRCPPPSQRWGRASVGGQLVRPRCGAESEIRVWRPPNVSLLGGSSEQPNLPYSRSDLQEALVVQPRSRNLGDPSTSHPVSG
jgi:hypothetical protein